MSTTTAVQAFADLLQQAVDSAVIQERSRGFRIGTHDYRSLLARRHSYDSDERRQAARFEPLIQDPSVRERLLDVIRDVLGQYIQNDTLQSAIIVTGGILDGFHVNDLLRHLLTIAFARGSHHAAITFYECAGKAEVKIQAITLLDGIRVPDTIEIDEGIRLIPMPNDTRDFPPFVITPEFAHYTDYFGRTLIVVDQLVSPVFASPDEMRATDFSLPFVRSNVSAGYSDFSEREFCEALSLSVNHIVKCVAWWSYIDPDEAYAVETTGRSAAYVPSDIHGTADSVEVTADDIRDAMSRYRAWKSLSPGVARRLRVPVDRWMRSKTGDAVDAFINLGTALEALYLGDGRYTGEVRFRLAVRAAWHLGSDARERISLRREFAKLYDVRSLATHTGSLEGTDASPELTTRAQELCRQSLTTIIQDGQFPNWDELIMGSA